MSDAPTLLKAFHDNAVRVSKSTRARLASVRSINTNRLKQGLAANGWPAPIRVSTIGGYAMHTLTQRRDGEQDIDVAAIFRSTDLPTRSRQARDLVHKAVCQQTRSERFLRPPECRTNAVTVWYEAGYHVDIAVFRQLADGRIQHAGAAWMDSPACEAKQWFTNFNGAKSPAKQPDQFRRIVRYLKYIRQGDDEKYPGGFFLLALAAACFKRSARGDHVSLLHTLEAIAEHLTEEYEILCPITKVELGLRETDNNRLEAYLELVTAILQELEPVAGASPSSARVLDAWREALLIPT